MKYYYNGIKVRTSNNTYTHGVMYGNKMVACCGSEDLALKRARSEVKYRTEQYIENKKFAENHPEFMNEKALEWLKSRFELISTIRVVELEVRP
ncbi:MAG: hypothetical protein J6S85_06430 [Methanobrevibacter sp.]|nr:hypothetical protein [Methanobrevibacter sp.]